MKKKPRIFALHPNGEIRPAFTHGGATVEAANATEARALFLRFAYKAAEEPPKVRATPRAYQLSHHTPQGLRVEAGPLTRTDSKGFLFSACIAGSYDDQKPENVKAEAASFAYYDGPEYNQPARFACPACGTETAPEQTTCPKCLSQPCNPVPLFGG